MKKRKAQDLSTGEREQIAQEFMFKINQAAEDDEEAVQSGRPALNKLKMLKVGSVDPPVESPERGEYMNIWRHFDQFFVGPRLVLGNFLVS